MEDESQYTDRFKGMNGRIAINPLPAVPRQERQPHEARVVFALERYVLHFPNPNTVCPRKTDTFFVWYQTSSNRC